MSLRGNVAMTKALLRIRALGATWMVALSAMATTPALSQILPLNSSGFRIIFAPDFSTGHAASARGFRWIDDTKVLFLANDRELSQYEKRADKLVMTKAVPTIHLWDVRAGKIDRYRKEPLADYLCAVDGQVSFGLKRGEEMVIVEGRYGEEHERQLAAPRDETSRLNRYTCKRYRYGDLPRRHGGRAIPVREEHGVLERSGGNAVDAWVPPFRWWNHTAGGSREIAFPQEHISDPLAYSYQAKGYLFRKDGGRAEVGMTNRLYVWLPETNSVRTLNIPGSANWAAMSHVTLTREGLLGVSFLPGAGRQNARDPGPAGIYFFSGPPIGDFMTGPSATSKRASGPLVVEQIIRGLTEEISDVSPDGCLVAVVVDPWNESRTPVRLQAIDVCNRGN